MNGACRKVVDILWADVPGEAAAVGSWLGSQQRVSGSTWAEGRAGAAAGVSQRERGFLAGGGEAMNGAAGWPTRVVRRLHCNAYYSHYEQPTAANGRAWFGSRMRALPVRQCTARKRRTVVYRASGLQVAIAGVEYSTQSSTGDAGEQVLRPT